MSQKKIYLIIACVIGIAALAVIVYVSDDQPTATTINTDNQAPTTNRSAANQLPTTPTSDWIDFTDPDNHFTGIFPTTPTPNTQTMPAGDYQLELTSYYASAPDESVYLINYTPLPADFEVGDVNQRLQDSLNGALQQDGNEPVSSELTTFTIAANNYPALKYEIHNTQGATLTGYFLVANDIIYQLMVVYPDDIDFDAPAFDAFVKAFRIL